RLSAAEPALDHLTFTGLVRRELAERDRLPQHYSHREHVGAAVEFFARQLLGGRVAQTAGNVAPVRAATQRARDPETGDLDLTAVAHEQVRGPHPGVHDVHATAMSIPELVGSVEPVEGVAEHREPRPQ